MAEGQPGKPGGPGQAGGQAGGAGGVGGAGGQGGEGDPRGPGGHGGAGGEGGRGPQGERGEPGPRNGRTLLLVLCAAAVVLMLVAGTTSTIALLSYSDIKKNSATIEDVEREGAARRDQSCRGLELGHKEEIDELARTYRFYADPPPEFRGLLDNPLVLEGLRDDERAAKNDRDKYGDFVPAYCDDPGFGLPEPDPAVPKRPPGL